MKKIILIVLLLTSFEMAAASESKSVTVNGAAYVTQITPQLADVSIRGTLVTMTKT